MFVYFFTEYATARQDGQDRNFKNIKLKNKQTEHIVKKIMQLKWQKNEKTKLPKMEWREVCMQEKCQKIRCFGQKVDLHLC